jgi:NADPH-dependent ferric siderophore reductase
VAKALRKVRIAAKQQLWPSMMRLRLGGTELADFPSGFDGGYIKLVLNYAEKPTLRSYTVRSFCEASKELTIDMVAHGDSGPAASPANGIKEGPRLRLPILVPANRGDVFLEVISEKNKIDLNLPKGLQVHWVINSDPEASNSILEDTVMALPLRNGDASVRVAGEFSAPRTLCQYFRHERQVHKKACTVAVIGRRMRRTKVGRQRSKQILKRGSQLNLPAG